MRTERERKHIIFNSQKLMCNGPFRCNGYVTAVAVCQSQRLCCDVGIAITGESTRPLIKAAVMLAIYLIYFNFRILLA